MDENVTDDLTHLLIPDSQDHFESEEVMDEVQHVPTTNLQDAISDITDYDEAAMMILNDANLMAAVLRLLSKNISLEWKSCLKVSRLTANNKERDYLRVSSLYSTF